MIGMIIMGHGGFASGLESAVRILAGIPEKFIAVDYRQEDSADDLEVNLKKAVRTLGNEGGILVLCDLAEDTPYKTAVSLKKKWKDEYDIEVVGGASLGMLVSINLARGYVSSVSDLADLAVDEGRKQIVKYDADQEED
ncbi:MAG TPA: PTS fructose transporter subunit IIA [Erysipelotrichaceae bacterium]|jgi:PTS system N-acetylgalactosamine-specific IIA component|nr:PTS fructose transporter subunit IIA [Erysipelotrichaceae bacterium]